MINLRKLKALKPCQDRLDNYHSFYGNKSFTPAQFMGLKNITHDDKLWVAFRILPKKQAVKAAADIAESVLPIYETKYPKDFRPRNAVIAAQLHAGKKISLKGLKEIEISSYAAADAAYSSVYSSAAYAANAAYAASSATNAPANTAYYAANAAYYAAADAASAAASRLKQEKLIRTIILRYWK